MADIDTNTSLIKEKEQVAALVQDMLVIRLRKHEIDATRAKSIARAVVETLKHSTTLDAVKQVIPTLTKEYAELQDVINKGDDSCKQDIEKLVTAFVRKLIKTGKFTEAHHITEDLFAKLSEQPFDCEGAKKLMEQEYAEIENTVVKKQNSNGTSNGATPKQTPQITLPESHVTAPSQLNDTNQNIPPTTTPEQVTNDVRPQSQPDVEMPADIPPEIESKTNDTSSVLKSSAEQKLIPIPEPTPAGVYVPPTQEHPDDHAAFKSLPKTTEEDKIMRDIQSEIKPGSTEKTVPIAQKKIPHNIQREVKSPATRAFDDTSPQPLVSDDQKQKMIQTVQQSTKKAASIGPKLAKTGKGFITMLGNAVFGQLDKLKDKHEQKQKAKKEQKEQFEHI